MTLGVFLAPLDHFGPIYQYLGIIVVNLMSHALHQRRVFFWHRSSRSTIQKLPKEAQCQDDHAGRMIMLYMQYMHLQSVSPRTHVCPF